MHDILASTILDRRICLVGDLQNDVPLRRAADTFDVPVVTSNDGREYIDGSFSTVFVVKEFEGDIFTYLSRAKQCILGPPALQQLAQQEKPLPCNTRPLYNLAMNGVVLCLTGFKVKDELVSTVLKLDLKFHRNKQDPSSGFINRSFCSLRADQHKFI